MNLVSNYVINIVKRRKRFIVQKRDIAVCIILTIITCGIYGLVWFCNITNDVAYVSDEHDMNGGTSLLLTIVTCGIYAIYWNYMMGKKLYRAKLKTSERADDNSILYLILSIFGLGIISYCLIQNELNSYSDAK